MPKKSRFISVEVSIKTDSDCDAFVDWFRAKNNYVEKIPCEKHRWYVYFSPLPSRSADLTIRELCAEISEWPREVRSQWDEAAFREFFVGYEVGSDPVAHLDHFSSSTLELAAQVGAGIGLALYPPTMNAAK